MKQLRGNNTYQFLTFNNGKLVQFGSALITFNYS